MAPLPYPIIDAHAHVYRADLPMASQRRYSPVTDASVSDYEKMCAILGATRSVLVQPSFLGVDNSFLLTTIAAQPERFRGIAVVEPDVALDDLKAMAAGGIVGIRVNLIDKPLPDVGHSSWDPLLNFVNAARWHVELHCEAERLPALIEPLIARDCRVVVDHFGRPDPQRGTSDPGFQYLLSKAASKRVWVKLSAGYRLGNNEVAATHVASLTLAALAAFTPDYLVWGSDWPHTQHPEVNNPDALLRTLTDTVGNPRALEHILWRTPERLFHFNTPDKGL